MRAHRGLTLVEVVAATVLLAAMAAACVPLLRELGLGVEKGGSRVTIEELAGFADDVLGSPERFGLSHDLLVSDRPLPPIEWAVEDPDGRRTGKVRTVWIRRLLSQNNALDRVWLAFDCDGECVGRCMARAPSKGLEGQNR